MSKKQEAKGSSNVFVRDDEFAWRPAVQEKVVGDKAYVQLWNYPNEKAIACDGGRAGKRGETITVNLKEYPSNVLPLQNVDANGNLLEFADMVKLPYLHEAAILYNMKKRHMDGKPYTRTGDIIIAINPFQWFTELYTEKKRTYYSNKIVWDPATGNDPRDGMEPHVYECSALSYKGLAFGRTDQSILVSGESGAGKTETVKICMSHIASVQQGPKGGSDGDSQELDPVVHRVVQSNPLLEAFGNASTRRNDNSSRFGKYLQLQFDNSKQTSINDFSRSTCTLAGSKCDVYLLEKNRVCYHEPDERTYHIFYQLVAAPDSEKVKFWDGLRGTNNKSFKYIGHTDRTSIEGMTDAQHFQHTVETLALVGVAGEKLKTLMRAIAIVLQCGNLTFGAKGGDHDKSEITSKKELSDLAELMGVCSKDLTLAFTERTMKTRTESYKVPLKPDVAKEAADSFAKEVYGKVFLWVVNEVNNATRAEDNYKDGTMRDFNYGIIGLLDIFGFESFTTNRFEQLCINYANEKLQQKFTEDVFRAVQEEYQAEGIALDLITYDDNTDVLDLIESRTGLLAMLNEECVRPKGNDQDFVQKALAANKNSPCLITNKYDRMSFGVHHYAGKVMYDAKGFVSSNQDTLPTDLEEIGEKCTNEIASKKFEEEVEPSAGGKAPPKRQKSNLVSPTIWVKYKIQLSSLMTNLRKTSSRYIRCIKPNAAKKPILMDHMSTVEQLRCAGVVAAVTLARSAFPNRMENSSVKYRYGSMWEDKRKYPSMKKDGMTPEEALRCDCDAILANALENRDPEKDKNGNVIKPYVCGKTKSYFRGGVLEYLEANRSQGLDGQAKTIQRFVRGMLARKYVDELVGSSKRRAQEEKEAKERAEREAREKKEREEREQRERMEREKAERDSAFKATLKKYNDEIEQAKRSIAEAEATQHKKLLEAAKRKEELEKELAELEESTGEEARQTLVVEPKKNKIRQEKKLEEATKTIENLKKESKKLRKEHAKIKAKYDVVKENNEVLMKANEESGNDFESKEDQMRKVDTKNMTLVETLEDAKETNKRLKEECMKKQDEYMTMAETRLEYQKTMARILNMIQEQSKENSIIEDTCNLALACEAESKGIMAELEAETECQ